MSTTSISSSHTIMTAPGAALHVLTSLPTRPSTKPTALFVHFWGGSARTWSAVAALLNEDFPLVRPTLRGWGHGASQGPADPNAYRINDHADDIAALVRDESLLGAGFFQHGVILVGHSMGAKIAQLVAARGDLKERLTGLVLIGPAPLGSLVLPPEMRAQQRSALSTRDSAEAVFKHLLLGSDIAADELRSLVDDCLGGNEGATKAWPEYGMGEDYEYLVQGEVESLKIPVKVVVGSLDKVETLERVDKVAQVLKRGGANIETRVLDGVGHLPPVEAPEQLAAIIQGIIVA